MANHHGQTFHRGETLVLKDPPARMALMNMMGIAPANGHVPAGRFGRMFGHLPLYEPTNAAIRNLALLMQEGDNEPNDSTIPLGFAFLGQFIDHDITLDPVSRLDERLDPEAVRNFRTPALDLDNVYGEGPDASRHMYDTGIERNVAAEHRLPFRLLTGTVTNEGDLPRNRQGTALIGDPRNDENLLVSQIHRRMLGFHNEVVQYILNKPENQGNPPANKDLFEEARKLVTLHYHWIVLHEFLPHIAGSEVVEDVLVNGRRWFRWEESSDRPYIPVEFSGAAYRFGHSLIRPTYNINDVKKGIELFKLPFFGLCEDCGKGTGIPTDYNLDFSLFFDTGTGTPQFCRLIDAKIARPLFTLPFIDAMQDPPVSLPERNMRRARTLKIPAGQDVAVAMGLRPLTNGELGIDGIDGLGGKAPLWFYILRESALTTNGAHLGPVGGRIVAETIIGMIDVVRRTYLTPQQIASWTPVLPNRSGAVGEFTMADLIAFRATTAEMAEMAAES